MDSTKVNSTNTEVNKVDTIISSLNTQVTSLRERLTEEREEHKEIYAKQKLEIEILKEKITELEKEVLTYRLNKKVTLDNNESSQCDCM